MTAGNLSWADGGAGEAAPQGQWIGFQSFVEKTPNALAMIAVHQPVDHLFELTGRRAENLDRSQPYLQWSYAQLGTAAAGLADALHTRGIRKGNYISTLLLNAVECAIVQLASSKLEAIFVPLDPQYLYREHEFFDLLGPVRPNAVFVGTAQHTQLADKIFAQSSVTPLKIFCTGLEDPSQNVTETLIPGWRNLFDFVYSHRISNPGSGNPLIKQAPPDPNLRTDVLFTSGTTSLPKGCIHTVSTRSAEFHAGTVALKVKATSRFICHTANFRGIYIVLSGMTWRVGGCVVWPSAVFNPVSTIRAIITTKATHLITVPAQNYAMSRCTAELANIKPNTLQYVFTGGDMVSSGLIQKCYDVKPVRAMPGWGMTEGAMSLGWKDEVPATIPATKAGICSLGGATPGSKIRICTPGTRDLVRRGEEGALHMGGDMIIKGYMEGRDAKSFYEDREGHWFITGDIAMMDTEGNIYVLGRIKDIIKRAGVPISPAVLENCINSVAGVESSIFSLPHAEYGEVPIAVIKIAPSKTKFIASSTISSSTQISDQTDGAGATNGTGVPEVNKQEEARIKQTLKDRVYNILGKDQQLDTVYTLADLGLKEFPLNNTGKIMKRELREMVLDLERNRT